MTELNQQSDQAQGTRSEDQLTQDEQAQVLEKAQRAKTVGMEAEDKLYGRDQPRQGRLDDEPEQEKGRADGDTEPGDDPIAMAPGNTGVTEGTSEA